jgi:hypothetical protein
MHTDQAVIPRCACGYEIVGGAVAAGRPRTMISVSAASFIDEDDPDVRLRVHPADGNLGAVTIDFPFTWFTGYKSAGRDHAEAR